MLGSVSGEIDVNLPATAVWEVYRSLQLADIVEKKLPHFFQKIEVVEGDGYEGTILKITYPPGILPFTYYKEKFTKIDEEKRVKEVEGVEGGYLEMGFNRYMVRFEIIEKDEQNCITKCTVEYDIKDDDSAAAAANAAMISIDPFITIMNIVAHHLTTET